jgi:hypothetical protein
MIYGLCAQGKNAIPLRSAAARYLVSNHEYGNVELDTMLSSMRKLYTVSTNVEADRDRWHKMMTTLHLEYRLPYLNKILLFTSRHPSLRNVVISDIDTIEEMKFAQSRGVKTILFIDGGGLDTYGHDHTILAKDIE